MTEIIRASENGGTTSSNNYIIPQNPSKRNILESMPVIIRNVLETGENIECSLDFGCKLNIINSQIAQTLNMKRITLNECGRINIPNYYAIVYAPSGYGKDRYTRIMEETVFAQFPLWFKNKEELHYQNCVREIEKTANDLFQSDKEHNKKLAYIEAEKKKIRRLNYEIQDGTKEGSREDYNALQNTDFGCINIRNPEFGLYLKSQKKNSEQSEFINSLYEAFDGNITGKSIKSENSLQYGNKKIPVNILYYSDPTLIFNELKDTFHSMLSTGFSRRSNISFQSGCKVKFFDNITYEQQTETYDKLKGLGNDLYSTFQKIPLGSCYILTKDSYAVLKEYAKYLNNAFNELPYEEYLMRPEIKSRELKALKLSCLYACLNHPNQYTIDYNDITQAICTIQGLSVDFERCINYKPNNKDKYELFFDFFHKNIGKKFTKTELKNKYKEIGFTREELRKKFDEAIEIVKEIAQTQNYVLIELSINNNSGREYQLIGSSQELPSDVLLLDKIIESKSANVANAL